MTLNEYKKQFTEDDAVGWMAIDTALEKVYGAQEPQNFAPPLMWELGGEDPLNSEYL